MKKMFLFIGIFSLFILMMFSCSDSKDYGEPITGKRWKIDIIKYINNSYSKDFETAIISQFEKEGFMNRRDYVLRIRSAQGDMTNLTMLVDSAVNDKTDIMVTLQSQTLYTAINRAPDVQKVFSLLQNPFIIGAGKSDTDHLPNLTGVYMIPPFRELFETLNKCSPKLKRLGTLYIIGDDESEYRKNELVSIAKKNGIEIISEGYTSQIEITEAAKTLLSRNIDGVIHLMDPAQDITFPALFQAARSKRKPVFSVVYNMQKLGASIAYSTDRNEIAEAFANMIIRIMRGEHSTNIPFENDLNFSKRVGINPAMAKDANFYIPESILDK